MEVGVGAFQNKKL